MPIRTALLNGNNINRDADFSKYIETVSEAGVIEGLEVSATKVGIGKARVPCERTGGETIYALVYNSSEVSISGDGDVYIQVSQTYIDDGELANEDGTGIATIQVGTMPSKNALKLATITSGTPTDARNMIPKVGELNTQIESIFDSLEDLDERVEALEEAGAIDHLEESGLAGELYNMSDTLFKQLTPKLENATGDCNISDTSDNAEIHIQRMGSGVASNKLKLKVKMVGESSQNLKVEVRKGVKVTVTEGVEAYWYGDEVVASGSIAYSDISSTYAEITVTLDANFGGTEGELLDVVVYMDNVNSSNYYQIACDHDLYSEGLNYIKVNGNTRTRTKIVPYCVSNGFAEAVMGKIKDEVLLYNTSGSRVTTQAPAVLTVTAPVNGNYFCEVNCNVESSGKWGKYSVSVNGVAVLDGDCGTTEATTYSILLEGINAGDTITLSVYTTWDIIRYNWCRCTYKKGAHQIPLEPRDSVELGETCHAMSYGNSLDNTFKGGIIVGSSASATTGEITLGNAVGFLEINYNGQIVKVPYYGI